MAIGGTETSLPGKFSRLDPHEFFTASYRADIRPRPTLQRSSREDTLFPMERGAMKKIADVMTRDVRIASPDQTIREAANEMANADIGSLPVGENDRLVGMIT